MSRATGEPAAGESVTTGKPGLAGDPVPAQDPGPALEAADDWDGHWQDFGEITEHNPAQAYRRRLILKLLGAGPGSCIVDIGSGQGDLAAAVHEAIPEAELLGLELGASGVAMAAAKVPTGTFLCVDLLDCADVPDAYLGWGTHAICSEVLEHVDDPVALLRSAARFLAPGARLVVTVPGGPRSAFDVHIGHRRHYTTADLRDVLERAGFAVVETAAAGFPVFNLYRLTVIARGRSLVDDLRASDHRRSSGLARAVLAAFGPLFRLNLRSRWGWQIVAVAAAPAPTPAPDGP